MTREPYLTPIHPTDLTVKDVEWLYKACEMDYYGYKPSHVIEKARNDNMQIFRMGLEEGIVITQVFDHPRGREFQVWSLAGTGLFGNIGKAFSDIQSYAEEIDAKWLTGYVNNKALMRVYERHFNGIGKVTTLFMKEI